MFPGTRSPSRMRLLRSMLNAARPSIRWAVLASTTLWFKGFSSLSSSLAFEASPSFTGIFLSSLVPHMRTLSLFIQL